MSIDPRVSYLVENNIAAVEIKSFANMLEKVFEKHRTLWNNYLELVEKYKEDNSKCSAVYRNIQEIKNMYEDPFAEDTTCYTESLNAVIFNKNQEELHAMKQSIENSKLSMLEINADFKDIKNKNEFIDQDYNNDIFYDSPIFCQKNSKSANKITLLENTISNNNKNNNLFVSQHDNVSSSDETFFQEHSSIALIEKRKYSDKNDDASKGNTSSLDTVLSTSISKRKPFFPVKSDLKDNEKERKVDKKVLTKPIKNISSGLERNNSDKEYSVKLGINKLYNVDTEILSDGKKMKQTKLLIGIIKKNSDNSNKWKTLCSEDVLKVDQHFTNRNENKTNVKNNNSKCVQDETLSEDVIKGSPEYTNALPLPQNLRKYKHRNLKSGTLKTLKHKNSSCSKLIKSDKFDDFDSAFIASPKCSFSEEIESQNLFKKRRCNSISNITTPFSPSIASNNTEQVKTHTNDKSIFQKSKPFSQSKVHCSTSEDETYFTYEDENVKENIKNIFEIQNNTKNKWLNKSENTQPITKKNIMNNNDISPQREKYETEDIYGNKPVRKKVEKAKLEGWSCWECEEYYKQDPTRSKEELKLWKNKCSRHKNICYGRPKTPPGFWSPLFSDTATTIESNSSPILNKNI